MKMWTRLKTQSALCVLILLSFFDSSLSSNLKAVKDESFTMLCYNEVAGANDLYIDLYFILPGTSTETNIAKYKISTSDSQVSASQYKGRLSFTPQNYITIKNIQISDEGTYRCVARSFEITGEEEKSNYLEVQVRPTIITTLIGSPLTAGTALVQAASCSARGGRPQAEVEWSTDRYLLFNQSVLTTDGEDTGTTNTISMLSVTPTKFYNDQPFLCTVRHPTLGEKGYNVTTISLDVQYSPSVPVIHVVNDNTQLRCESEGNPVPTITWVMPNNNPTPNPKESSSTIRIVSPEDPARQNDTYICNAKNGILPSTTANITTAEAVTYVAVVKTTNTGAIVGAVVGCVLLLAIIGVAVYWFFIRKQREKDSGPYNPKPKKIVRATDDEEDGWGRSSGRPIIQHANESLNKNAPPGPTRPPPQDDEDEGSNCSHSDVEEFTVGHDVDLNGQGTDPEDNDMPTTGIVSKNSVNFQHRRQRPSTSPHRRSQNRNPQPQPTPRTPQMSDPHYEVPPKEYYQDENDGEDDHLMGDPRHNEDPMDDRFYDRPEDRYPGFQPRYEEPPRDEHLPPYSDAVQYASIDHSYNGGKPRTRPPYQEPVEYAEIRSKGQIV